MSDENPDLDVAIVGAGPGGLYCALRLLSSDSALRIGVFEHQGRVGGRVCTVPLRGPFTCDIGAMRFLPQRHLILNALIDEFPALERFDFEVPLASWFLRDRHIVPFLSEKLYQERSARASGKNDGATKLQTLHEFVPATTTTTPRAQPQTSYVIDEVDAAYSPDQLLARTIAKILASITFDDEDVVRDEELKGDPELDPDSIRELLASALNNFKVLSFDYLTPREWRALQKHGRVNNKSIVGRKLYDISLWELIQNELDFSMESIALIRDTLGYQTIFGTWNAAEHLPWFLAEFGPTVRYQSIQHGMSGLIEQLGNRIRERSQGAEVLFVRHALQRVSRGAAGHYELRFLHSEGEASSATQKVVTARKVILAMSAGALSKIEFSELQLSKELAGVVKRDSGLGEVLRCITPNPLMKAFAFYENPWYWDGLPERMKSDSIATGRCKVRDGVFMVAKILTDLPVRQLYLFGPTGNWWHPTNAATPLFKGMVMAYCDARDSEYWASLAGLQNLRDKEGDRKYASKRISKNVYNDPEFVRVLAEYGVYSPFAHVFRGCVNRVFQTVSPEQKNPPAPDVVLFQDWSKAPFYGGWHAWNMRCQPWLLRRYLARPFEGENIFLCGEAISADQGWIEGAFRTAERVLSEYFSLERPAWSSLSDSLLTSCWGMSNGAADVDSAFKSYIRW